MPKKICLAYPKAPVGGSYLFLTYFEAYLKGQGWEVTHDLKADYDILFFNSWTLPYPQLLRAKRKNPHLRVVQRVDGAAADYGRHDGVDSLQAAANTLADLTIFQSQYSYDATVRRFKLIGQDGPIIHNAVDIGRFSPDGLRLVWEKGIKRLITVGWSTNPLKGNWRIPILARANPDIEFIIVGRAGEIERLPNMRFVDYLTHEQLPQALRGADVYLSLIENDACPNVILEALACGLPILYLPSGGVPELVRGAGLAFDAEQMEATFRPSLDSLLVDCAAYKAEARRIAIEEHAPDLIYGRYLDAIEASERHPFPHQGEIRRGLLNYRAYQLGEQRRKWRRILKGEQSLRGARL